MNLINKRLLAQKIQAFEFPTGEKQALTKKLLEGWQKALKDSDLERTKEKSVQGKFLNTFFEDILGYTDVTTGQNEWTLIQHPRIEHDSMEPDGSLGWFTTDQKLTRAVIELKDAKTSLDKKQLSRAGKYTPIEQAYLYATKYEGCNWIIVSNFKEIRLYNKQRTQEYYEKFEVLELNNEAEFKRFYYLLSKDNLISKDKESVIDILAKDTTVEEQNITKKFYAEFKQTRLKLLDHLINHNPELTKQVLLEKTQKLLDRLIFTLVCEDTSNLLPFNIVKNTYERAINSLSPSDERVWTEFKGLFLAIDKGNSRVKPPINAYNGGLFAFDDLLDNLKIKDDIWQVLIELANYDFETDLNVNILGHIFEQSISDLESIKESINLATEDGNNIITEDGNKIEVSTKEKLIERVGKRKKDGIFYTPEYITRHIVENTVGKYLEEHPDQLETIKILDPACGSGAFLNQAHSFLFNEHRNRYEAKINEKIEKGENISLFDYKPAEADREILLNNLYGVDLNQESVDITKLALWLKTARKSEPLQSLDKNIKCGNSLIDDPNVSENKAFNWNSEFDEIMDSGGFDIIIGNPPYVRPHNISDSDKVYLWGNYDTASQKSDLYSFFIEKGIKLLKEGGYLGFIVPQTWMSTYSFKKLREFILNNTEVVSIGKLPLKVFEDASVQTLLLFLRKTSNPDKKKNIEIFDAINNFPINTINISTIYEDSNYNFQINNDSITHKMDSIETKVKDVFTVKVGIVSGNDSKFVVSEKTSDIDKPYLKGGDVKRYLIDWSGHYIHYDKQAMIVESKSKKISTLKGGGLFCSPKEPQDFEIPKILIGNIGKGIRAVVDENNFYANVNVILLQPINEVNLYFYSGLFNSKLYDYYLKSKVSNVSLNTNVVKMFPLKMDIDESRLNIAVNSRQLQELHFQINKKIKDYTEFSNGQFGLSFKSIDFINGWNIFSESLREQKIKLNSEKQEQLFTWFKLKQKEIQDLHNKIKIINNQIDEAVYKLYGLTFEEIKVVEKEKIL